MLKLLGATLHREGAHAEGAVDAGGAEETHGGADAGTETGDLKQAVGDARVDEHGHDVAEPDDRAPASGDTYGGDGDGGDVQRQAASAALAAARSSSRLA